MKKYRLSIFLSALLLITTGCSSGPGILGGRFITGPAAQDIVEYVNQGLISIAELEKRSLESYASVTGDNYTTDQKIYETLKNFVIPTHKRFVESLRGISPENPEIRKVHAIYVKAAETMNEGFYLKMIGIENRDEGLIIQSNKKIEEGRAGIEKWNAGLKELYKKHGVAEE